MKDLKYNLPIVAAILAIAAVTAWIYLADEDEAGPGDRRAGETPVRLQHVTRQSLTDTLEALGTARANEAVIITAQSAELVESVHFEDGDVVSAGDLLVRLRQSEESAQVRELEINLAEAHRQLDRLENLATENATSRSMLDEQASRAQAIEAQLEQARASLAERTITAPFDGILGNRQVSPGTLVSPGMTITTLDDVSTIKVDFSIPESFIPTLATGQLIESNTAAYGETTFSGQLTSIGSRVDPVTRAVSVRAVIDNADNRLRPGMLMQIILIKNQREAMVIPESAVIPLNNQHFVYIVSAENLATRVEVTLGDRRPGLVEIKSGLALGDRVVVEGTMRLKDGNKVSVLDSDTDSPET